MKEYISYLKSELYNSIKTKAPDSVVNRNYIALEKAEKYYDKTEAYIKDLELDYFIDTTALRQQITMLEAVLLIHGVNDFPVYMSKGLDYLKAWAVENNSKGILQLPATVSEILTDKQRSEIIKHIQDATK